MGFPAATGAFTSLLNQIGLAAKLITSKVRRAGLANILGYTGETNVQGEQVQKLDEVANETLIASLRAAAALRGDRQRGDGGDQDPLHRSARQVRRGLRSARRLLQHRRQHLDRDDLRRPPPQRSGRRRHRGRLPEPRQGPARGRLRALRLLDDAGDLHRRGGRCPRLHLRPDGGRVLPLAREPPHPRARQDVLDQRGQLRRVDRRGEALERVDQEEDKAEGDRTGAATWGRSSPTRTAPCSRAASSPTRPTRRAAAGSSACSTRPTPSPSSSRPRAARRRRAASASSTSCPRRCTSASRWSSARPTTSTCSEQFMRGDR